MKKIAIIGTENSHASAFAKIALESNDIQIVGAYGDDPAANEKFSQNFNIDCSANSPDAFVGLVDGIMITSRRGSTHFNSALPYLSEGMTVFIDKPITVDFSESKELINKALQNGVKLCGGSCLKYAPNILRMKRFVAYCKEDLCSADFCAPVDMESEYDGFFFYSQHLVEMCLTVLGNSVKSVYAMRNGNNLTAILNYGKFNAVLSFGSNIYRTSVLYKDFERHTEIKNVVGLYANEFNYFESLLNGEEMNYSYKDIIYPVAVLNAIYRSYTKNCEVKLDEFI